MLGCAHFERGPRHTPHHGRLLVLCEAESTLLPEGAKSQRSVLPHSAEDDSRGIGSGVASQGLEHDVGRRAVTGTLIAGERGHLVVRYEAEVSIAPHGVHGARS